MTGNTGRSIRRLSDILLLAFVFLTAFSCTRDETPGSGSAGGEAMVRLTIRTPGVSTPRAITTRSGSVDEYGIENIKVIVLERRGGEDYRYRYMADGENVRPGEDNKTTFYALLKGTSLPVKLLIFANYADAFDSYVPAAGETEEAIRHHITASFVPGSDYIPMYSEVSLEGLDTETVKTISATMLRAWARVDVKTDLEAESKPFLISDVYAYRPRSAVQVAPDVSALAGSQSPRVLSPSVPDGADTLAAYKITTYDPTLAEGLYLAECAAVEGEAAQLRGVTCLVIGGYYDGDDFPSYYRVDFNSGAEGHPFGQVLRNYRYTFSVKSVTGRGWENPDDAANNRATFIVADIKMWEDFTTEMHSGGDNYFGISSRSLFLAYKKGSEKQLHVQSTVPYTVAFENAPDNFLTLGDGGSISNNYFRVRIVTDPAGQDDISHLEITALQENMTTENFESKLIVKYGSWIFRVSVTQYHFKEFAARSIRVLSVHAGSSGHLGNMSGYGDGSGMRRILSNVNNFSASGTVNFFSGFDFTVSPSIEYFRYADGTNTYTHQVRSWLFACDVLYLANDNYISEYSARIIMEWLKASPTRVLIMGGDGDQTSPTLIRQDKKGEFSGDVDWWYNQVAATDYHLGYINGSGGFRSVPAGTRNEEFFNKGPFPTGSSTITFSVADNYFGYAKSYKEDIIPLITHTNLAGSMVVGVDKGRRVVYHGDASLWQPGRVSTSAANTGTISSDIDRFWANLWAWVAYQVIWGDQEVMD